MLYDFRVPFSRSTGFRRPQIHFSIPGQSSSLYFFSSSCAGSCSWPEHLSLPRDVCCLCADRRYLPLADEAESTLWPQPRRHWAPVSRVSGIFMSQDVSTEAFLCLKYSFTGFVLPSNYSSDTLLETRPSMSIKLRRQRFQYICGDVYTLLGLNFWTFCPPTRNSFHALVMSVHSYMTQIHILLL